MARRIRTVPRRRPRRRQAEARGVDLKTTLPSLIADRSLVGVEDPASVIHARISALHSLAALGARPDPGHLIVGLIPAAIGVADPDLSRALTERAELIETRALAFAELAVERRRPWVRGLGHVPSNPAHRGAWTDHIATIAAYRERWGIAGSELLGRADVLGVEQLEQATQAGIAVRRAQRLASPNDGTRTTDTGQVPALALELEVEL